MSKREEKIKKLFRETLINGIFLDFDSMTRDVVDSCEEQGKLFTYKGLFVASVRTTSDNADYIRIVFVVKESESGKVKDIDKIFDLIRDVESALVCVNKCEQSKSDGFIYIDVLKKLIPDD